MIIDLLPQVGKEAGLTEVRHHGASLLVQQDVVRVEVAVDDGLGQIVEVIHAPGHVHSYAQLVSDVHWTPVLVQNTEGLFIYDLILQEGKKVILRM